MPLLLVLAGLIPFMTGAAVLWLLPMDSEAHRLAGPVLLLYGALILSFLGGVRWGAEINAQGSGGIPRPALLAWSVTGSLAGWALVIPALVAPGATGLLLAGAGFMHLLHCLWDGNGAALPIWYRRLRLPAGLGAASLLSAGALAYLIR